MRLSLVPFVIIYIIYLFFFYFKNLLIIMGFFPRGFLSLTPLIKMGFFLGGSHYNICANTRICTHAIGRDTLEDNNIVDLWPTGNNTG